MNPPTPELQEMIVDAAQSAVADHFRDQCLIEFTAALLNAICGLGPSPNTTADRIVRDAAIVTEKLVEFRRASRSARVAPDRTAAEVIPGEPIIRHLTKPARAAQVGKDTEVIPESAIHRETVAAADECHGEERAG